MRLDIGDPVRYGYVSATLGITNLPIQGLERAPWLHLLYQIPSYINYTTSERGKETRRGRDLAAFPLHSRKMGLVTDPVCELRR